MKRNGVRTSARSTAWTTPRLPPNQAKIIVTGNDEPSTDFRLGHRSRLASGAEEHPALYQGHETAHEAQDIVQRGVSTNPNVWRAMKAKRKPVAARLTVSQSTVIDRARSDL